LETGNSGMAHGGLEVLPGCHAKTEKVVCFTVDKCENPKARQFFEKLNRRLKDLDVSIVSEGNLLEVTILR